MSRFAERTVLCVSAAKVQACVFAATRASAAMASQSSLCALLESSLASDSDDDGHGRLAAHAESPAPAATPAAPTKGEHINAAIARIPLMRKSLIRPSVAQGKKILAIHAKERFAQKQIANRNLLDNLMSNQEVASLASDHAQACKDFSGIRWDLFSETFTLASVTQHVQDLAAKPSTSMLKVGITTDVPWRFYFCEGKGKSNDMPSYFHNGYSQIWVLALQSSHLMGHIER